MSFDFDFNKYPKRDPRDFADYGDDEFDYEFAEDFDFEEDYTEIEEF